ncbi:MAG: glycosyltransferase [Acidimicrobiia bacterium]
MARYRSHQHSKTVRSNVDLYVEDLRVAKKWVRLTPDTYRVVVGRPTGSLRDDVTTIGNRDDELAQFVGWHDSDVAVRAAVSEPSMFHMRIVEPAIVPRSVALPVAVLADLDLPDRSPHEVFKAATDAGLRIGVLPDGGSATADSTLPPPAAPVVVILAGVPLHDIGGGSRGAQMAFELLRRSYSVVYVNRYPAAESVDLGLRYLHPRLTQLPFERWERDRPVEAAEPGLVIVEAPMREFVVSASELAKTGWRVAYDIIDDWTDRALGGDWYSADQEEDLMSFADGVVASAPDLVAHAGRFGVEAALVPNGVNQSIFGATDNHGRPDDLPSGRLMGYHGSLYGDWFDWEALRSVTGEFDGHVVVVIGDAGAVDRQSLGLPDNIVLLGLKAQAELPPYLRAFEVGLVPFKVTNTTHAVSPLKVYEYLACGVPVAAPPLRALEGIDGVYTDADLVSATRRAMEAPHPDGAAALVNHGWGARLTGLFKAVDLVLQPPDGLEVRIVRRAPVRYARRDRLIH